MNTIPKDHLPKIEDLQGDIRQVAEIIEKKAPEKGAEIAMDISSFFQGTNIYCHGQDKVKRAIRNRIIIEKYDAGVSASDLAREFKISSRQIANILNNIP